MRAGVVTAIATSAAALFVLSFSFGYAYLHDGRIAAGTRIAGVALDGMERDAAERELRRALPGLGLGTLTLSMGAADHTIAYADIARDYDFQEMLDAALKTGHVGGIAERLDGQLRAFVEGRDVPLATTWDRAALREHVAAAVEAARVSPTDASLAIGHNGAVVEPSVDGWLFDASAALALAESAIEGVSPADTHVQVPGERVAPAVPTELAQSAAGRVRRVAAAPLRVVAGGSATTIAVLDIIAWTRIAQEAPGSWRVSVDPDEVREFMAGFKALADVPAIDGTYGFKGQRAVVRPAVAGYEIDLQGATEAVLDALLARADGASATTVQLDFRAVAPRVTTDDARELVRRVERLSRWTTFYERSSRNGFGVNITRPTELIDGTVLQPGEQFDFVSVAGPISPANGYTDGAAIINGNTKLDGVVGGGLCSASTTIFNAALRAGFQIDARRAHAYFIDRYPIGLDATIWVSGRRIQTVAFTNDSPYPILIRGLNAPGSVTFEIYGVADGRRVRFGEPVVTNRRQAWTELEYTDDLAAGVTERVEYAFDGFDSVVSRTVTAGDGALLHADEFRSSYRRVTGLIRIGREADDPPPGTRVVLGD